ncbi:MAG: hypothetical protein V4686_01170 [Patescibacteria group bacterium]
MEKLIQHEPSMAHKNLEAHLRGIHSVHKDNPERVQEMLYDFVTELREKHSQEALQGSEAYHMVAGSSLRSEPMVPDPFFDEIDSFVKNKLSNI